MKDQQTETRTAAQILVAQLKAQGTEKVTCVPGESYLAVLDALHGSGIEVIAARNEGGAALMAEAQGKLTGRPGVCFVTRGPGAANATAGIHVAMQDSTPMILFVGQIARGMREREAFQEVDYRAMFGKMAKWVAEVDDASRMVEFVARAYRIAMQGRPGPVVLALPEDMLTERATCADAPAITPAACAPAIEDLARLDVLLAAAEKPLVIAGGSGWTAEASLHLAAFSEQTGLPVATSFRRASLFAAEHPNYVGDLGIGPAPHLSTMVRDADLIVLLGGRMSETPSSAYSLLEVPLPAQKLVHIHPSAEEIGRVYQPELGIIATPASFLDALQGRALQTRPDWAAQSAAGHAAYLDWSGKPRELPGPFQFGEAVRWLSDRLPEDAIITNGAGNYAGWVHRHHRFNAFATQLAPTSGTMGYGVPAAIMAKKLRPGSPVIAYAGDGCFMMTGQEFATAVQYGANIVVVLVDNGQYGTIRMHQEREYPGRQEATRLVNPDFVAYAEAFGGRGFRVETLEDFKSAIEEALVADRPCILHCRLPASIQSHAADFPAAV